MFDDKNNLLFIYALLPNMYRFCPSKSANIIFPPTCFAHKSLQCTVFSAICYILANLNASWVPTFSNASSVCAMISATHVDWSNIKLKTKHVSRNPKHSLRTWADTRPPMSTWILSQLWGHLVAPTRPLLLNKLRLLDSLATHFARLFPIKFPVADKISGSALKGALVQKLADSEDFYITAAEYSSEEEIDEQMPMEMDTDEENSVNLEAIDAVPANAVGVDCTMRDAFCAHVDKLKQMTNAYNINEENCIAPYQSILGHIWVNHALASCLYG